jgi:putative hydrolase of the HAD superfamily
MVRERRPGIRLGIITNGDLDFQLRKIDFLGIGERFEHIVASGELGVTKPDERIFAHAVDLFDAAPDECVYVGDRLHTDAIGAARAGLLGVWLDRTARGVSAEDVGTVETFGVVRIAGLAELTAALS